MVNKRKLIWGIVISATILVGWHYLKEYIKANRKYFVLQHKIKHCSAQVKKAINELKKIKNSVKSIVNMVKRFMSYLSNIYIYLEEISPLFFALSNGYKQLKQFLNDYFNIDINKYVEELYSLGIRKLFYHKKEKQIMKSLTYYTNKEKQLEVELSMLK